MDDSLIRFVGFVAAVIPAFLILVYFSAAARVRIDEEDTWNAFGLGACSALIAVFAVVFYERYVGYGSGFYELALSKAYIGAAIPEELGKFAALLALLAERKRLTEPAHIFVYAIAVSCGFAGLENVFYVLESTDWTGVAIFRSLSSVPGHAFGGAIMGYCVYRALHGQGGQIWWLLAVVIPIALHGAYNFPLFALGQIELGYIDAPLDASIQFVFGFIFIVILEGALAHLCLSKTENETAHPEVLIERFESGPPAQMLLQRVVDAPMTWGIMGLLAVAGAGFVVYRVSSEPNNWLDLGFAGFALLHGMAFFGLAMLLRRRQGEPGRTYGVGAAGALAAFLGGAVFVVATKPSERSAPVAADSSLPSCASADLHAWTAPVVADQVLRSDENIEDLSLSSFEPIPTSAENAIECRFEASVNNREFDMALLFKWTDQANRKYRLRVVRLIGY